MNELQIFNYESKEIRTVLIDGVPFWIARDLTNILGYANYSDAISRHCRGIVKHYPLQTKGGLQEVRLLSEPDMYRLIVKSNLPSAEKFEKWVFEDVLPSIRKTGQYGVKAPSNLIEALKLALEQAEQIEEMKPKALEYDKFMSAENLKDVGEVARYFGIGRNTFFKQLRDNGIFLKNNTPRQEYMHHFEVKVKAVSKGCIIENESVTFFKPSGISYIAKRFKLTEV